MQIPFRLAAGLQALLLLATAAGPQVPLPVPGPRASRGPAELGPAELEAHFAPLARVVRPAEYRLHTRGLKASHELASAIDPTCTERIRSCFDSAAIDHGLLGDVERLLNAAPGASERIAAERGEWRSADYWIEMSGPVTRERELPLDSGRGSSLLIVPAAKLAYEHETRLLNLMDPDSKLHARSPSYLFFGLPVTAVDRATAGQGTWTATELDDAALGRRILRLRGAQRGTGGLPAVLIDLDLATRLPLAQAKVDALGKLTSLAFYRFQAGADATWTEVPERATTIVRRADGVSIEDCRVSDYAEASMPKPLRLAIDDDVMLVDKRAGKDDTQGRVPSTWPAVVLENILLPGQAAGNAPVGPSPSRAPASEPETARSEPQTPGAPASGAEERDGGLGTKAWLGIGVGLACIAGAIALRMRRSA